MISTGNWGGGGGGGGKDRREERQKIWGKQALGGKGKNYLNRERVEKILGRKREKLSGGRGLRWERGKGGGKILGRKRRRSGDKGLRGETAEMISTGKGVEKILGRKGRRSGGKKANRERGERSKEGQTRSSQGGKALGGKGWEGSQKGKGGKQS